MSASPLRWSPLVALLLALAACDTGASVVGGLADADAATPTDLAVDTPDVSALDAPDVPARFDAPDVPDVPLDVPPARCAADSDCVGHASGPACDVATGQCVPCTAASDLCPATQYCVAATNTCTAGCRDDAACATATTDAGASAASHCELTTHACVACLSNDHCPAGTVCTGHVCVVGCSVSSDHCPTGQSCCAGACVDPQSNLADCGGCGLVCTRPHAAPACTGGTCLVASCILPYADCDAVSTNGCETDTTSTVEHCGGCGNACDLRPHATASCAASACAYACDEGFDDCDGDPTNGCETDTRSTVDHCGTCATHCALGGATAACVAGACAVASCNAGRADCNTNPADGCEATLASDPLNCGVCGTACTAAAGAAQCFGGQCAAPSCAAVLTANPVAASGPYLLDLDGAGPNVPRTFYCDMHDGGWTVVANQVPTELLTDSTATLGAAVFGDITHSWRLGSPDIAAVRPAHTWRLSDVTNNVYFVPSCVVDWLTNHDFDTAPTECTLGYSDLALRVPFQAWVFASARGIAINNRAAFCSIRMYESGFGHDVGAQANGRAYTCNYNTSTRVSLAFR